MLPVYRKQRPKRRHKPHILTHKHAERVLRMLTPMYGPDGSSRRAQFVGFRTIAGTRSAMWLNPMTGQIHRWAVDYASGMVRDLGPYASTPPRLALPKPSWFH